MDIFKFWSRDVLRTLYGLAAVLLTVGTIASFLLGHQRWAGWIFSVALAVLLLKSFLLYRGMKGREPLARDLLRGATQRGVQVLKLTDASAQRKYASWESDTAQMLEEMFGPGTSSKFQAIVHSNWPGRLGEQVHFVNLVLREKPLQLLRDWHPQN